MRICNGHQKLKSKRRSPQVLELNTKGKADIHIFLETYHPEYPKSETAAMGVKSNYPPPPHFRAECDIYSDANVGFRKAA